MNKTLTLQTPAKINLYLKVLNKRLDGYHNLSSLMQMIGLYDDLHFEEKSKGIDLQVENSPLAADKTNLVYRAAALLHKTMLAEGHPEKGVSIILKKKIPVAAGLAGGSSDGAATFIGLNRLWGLNWPKEKLAKLSSQLGSDLPFFFEGPSAWISGRGEIVEAVQPPFQDTIVLVYPEIPVSTASVFSDYSKHLRLTKREPTLNIPAIKQWPALSEIFEAPRNDLEEITLNAFPQLKKIKSALSNQGGHLVLMSGSGPSIFGLFGDQTKASSVTSQIKQLALPQPFHVWTLPLLQHSPYQI